MSFNTKNYRWDIQGLRAIAVLAVVVFHINPLVLPGGYVGVDIFFVISGYLIMGFIWRDLKNNNFNLLRFYTKRIYRLFPALFVMVVLSSIAAYYILLPNESEIYLKSMFSTLFYFSNFYFYTEADYFNDAMEFYPLLHTWSLSVEEQFYMVFPLILIWVYKKQKKYIFAWLIFIGMLSLVLSQWYVHKDASLSFFASPTRFFQFIMGGAIAITLQKHKPSKYLGDIGVASGLILIAISIYWYSEKTLFPGINALLPSIGTGLVLYFGIQTYYSKFILENKLVDIIGNASYSIYLWHWPLIVFYKLKVSPNLSLNEQWALFSLSIIFGILSWMLIENKFRKSEIKTLTMKPIVKVFALSTFIFVLNIVVFKYYPYKILRYQTKAYEYLDFNTSSFRDGKCFLTSNFNDVKFYNKTECVRYEKAKKNYLLIGDSHAAHYYSALHALLRNDETLTQVTSSGCIPIIPFKGIKRCSELMNWAFNDLITIKHFDTIILSGHWGYVNHKGIVETAKYLKNYTDKIIVLGPSMQYSQPLPRLLVKLGKEENSAMIYKSAGKYKALMQIDNAMKSYFNLEKVHYISVLKVLCDNGKCETVTMNGTPINFDESHLTHEGAYYILKSIEEEIFQR